MEGIREFLSSITFADALISGIFGLIAGAIGSLIAPWIHWGIEKRRDKRNQKRRLIEECRTFLSDPSAFNQQTFLETTVYVALRSHFSPNLVHDIENGAIHTSPQSGDPIRQRVLQELSALEEKWDLV